MSTAMAVSTAGFRPTVVKTRLHLTRRGRVVVTALAAIPVVVGAALFAINGGGAAAIDSGAQTHFSYATVQSGESLWSIAERVAPHADPRDVISEIVALNQLSGTMVVPGERVAIPAQYGTGR